MKRRDVLRGAGALAAWLAWPVPARPPIPAELPADAFFTIGDQAIRITERFSFQVAIPQAFATLRTSADTGPIARRPVRSAEEAAQLRDERDRAEAFAVHPLGGHCHCARCGWLRSWASRKPLPTYPGIRTERFRA